MYCYDFFKNGEHNQSQILVKQLTIKYMKIKTHWSISCYLLNKMKLVKGSISHQTLALI